MGLKDSLKRLFSTSKKVGTEKVEQSIDQVKEFAKENSGKVNEVVDQAKVTIKEFGRETSEKIQEKAEETKDKIETKVGEVWDRFEEKAVIVVDNLEAKIRGVEPTAEFTVIAENPTEATAGSIEIKVAETIPGADKPDEAAKV